MKRLLQPFIWVLTAWLLTRLLLGLTVGLAVAFLPVDDGPGRWRAFPELSLLDGWVRWDSAWYADIARDGYAAPDQIVSGKARNTAFFPLYPLLVRVLAGREGNIHAAGLWVTNLSFLGALLLFHDLVRRRHNEAIARRASLLLLLHPFSFFFNAMYTESLFLLLAVAAFSFAERRHWIAAGLSAGLCATTRVVGILALPGLLARGLEQKERRFLPMLLGMAIGVGVLSAHLLYLWHRYGSPFEFMAAQRAPGWVGDLGFLPKGPMDLLNLGVLLLALILTGQTWKRGARAEAVWCVLMLLASLNRWPSMGRLSLVLFPLYVSAALLLPKQRHFTIACGLSGLLLLSLACRFALWGWVA